jgi:hypothetical protein
MKTIFIVTSGEYSDYCIEAVFSRESDAKKYAREKNRVKYTDACQIEPWSVDERAGWVPRTEYICRIGLETGDILNETEWSATMAPKGKRSGGPAMLSSDSASVTSYVSPDHARKLAVEARQKWLRKRAARPASALAAGGDA